MASLLNQLCASLEARALAISELHVEFKLDNPQEHIIENRCSEYGKGTTLVVPHAEGNDGASAPEVHAWPSAAKEAAEKIGWARDVALASCRPVREFKQLPAGSRRYNKYCGTFSATCKAAPHRLRIGMAEAMPLPLPNWVFQQLLVNSGAA